MLKTPISLLFSNCRRDAIVPAKEALQVEVWTYGTILTRELYKAVQHKSLSLEGIETPRSLEHLSQNLV